MLCVENLNHKPSFAFFHKNTLFTALVAVIENTDTHEYELGECKLCNFIFDFLNIHSLCLHTSPGICSSSAQKYFRRATRLNWPEGAVSRESIRAVRKLDRLKVSVSLKFALSQLIITFYLETLIHSCYWSGYLFFLDFKGNWVWLRLEVRVCTYSY